MIRIRYASGAGFFLWLVLLSIACSKGSTNVDGIQPIAVTDTVKSDSDDPAIWIHPTDPGKSLILGTDKAGILFAFDLHGRTVKQVHEEGMMRLNNVDVEYGMLLNGTATDIAVATDRDAKKVHTFALPELTRIDHGGFEPFEGEEERRAMGIGLYKRPRDGKIFAILSRKGGPSGTYLWQYLLEDDGTGHVQFTKVRSFGEFSGVNEAGDGEIEAIVVDDEQGYVYYSDEIFGIRKYHADPDTPDANQELAVFGTDGFQEDREGISIYRIDRETGYILVSDQHADRFQIFTREGTPDNPHEHRHVKTVHLSTSGSDGSETTSRALDDRFPGGLFVAMSEDKTFQLYSWKDISGGQLRSANSKPTEAR